MDNNPIQVLPFFIIIFSILISGFTVIFTWIVVWILPVRLREQVKLISFMNFATIAIITIISTVVLYLIFLVLGVGGINKNRKAQGLDQKSSKWLKKEYGNRLISIYLFRINILNLCFFDKYLLEFYSFEGIRPCNCHGFHWSCE